MSWFRRSSSSAADAASNAPQNPHLQALKRQARNRLIGMSVLIVLGIALFAWVLDTEPRQTDREIVYDIPARGEKLSVQIPAAAQQNPANADQPKPEAIVPASAADTPAQIRARRRAALAENEEILDDAPLAAGNNEPVATAEQNAAAAALAKQAASAKVAAEKAAVEKAAREKAQKAQQAESKAKEEQVAQAKAEKAQKDKARAEEAARARALLEGKTEPKPETKADTKASAERSIVQFGSFADAAKAAEVRRKVEGTGLKTYTQEIDTPRGKLIRLRVGPFNKAEDAEAAAKKIKALGLPAAILAL